MAHANDIISRPVRVRGDIATVLGVSSGDVRTLCTSSAIKPWAKYKPVNYPTLGVTGKTSGSQYWKASDGKCGFVIQEYTEFGNPLFAATFAGRLLNGRLRWTPAGLSSDAYARVLDFDGYDHNARSPIFPWEGITALQVDSQNELHVQWDVQPSGRPGELTLADFTINGVALTSYYFGCILWYSNSSYEVIADKTVANGGFDIVFLNMQNWRGRTVKIVPFFSLNRITQGGSIGTGRFFAFDIDPVTIEIASGAIDYRVNIDAIWNSARTKVTVTINVENLVSVSKTFSGNVTVYKGSQAEATTTYTLTVPGNSTQSVNKTLNVTYDYTGEFEVYVTGFYETLITQIEEPDTPLS